MIVACNLRPLARLALLVPLLLAAAPSAECEAGPGTDYWFGFMPNDPMALPTLEIHLLAEQPVDVTVEHPIRSPSFRRTVRVEPGVVTVVSLPEQAASDWMPDQVQDNAVRAFAAAPFTALLAHRANRSSDATAALPRMALGLDHFLVGEEPLPRTASEFLVVATEDATLVQVTPAVALGIHPAGVPYELTLDAGEGYFAEAGLAMGDDTTGTRVKTDKPVAVFSGHACARAPRALAACDHLFEVAEPVAAWEREHLLAVVPDRPSGSIFRVLGSTDATQVSLDGLFVGEIGVGEWLELTGVAAHGLLEATAPVGVVQFVPGLLSPGATNGDPAIANVLPESLWTRSHAFTTLDPTQFDEDFLVLTVADADVGVAGLNGVPVDAAEFVPVAGSGRSVAVVPLAPGVHRTLSAEPHSALVGGYATADSYLYAAAPGAACAVLGTLDGATICEGEEALLDASSLVLAGCGGGATLAWFDPGGLPLGSDPLLLVAPGEASEYSLELTCSADPGCTGSVAATVTVLASPTLASAGVSEPSDCRLGLLVEWAAASFPSGAGVYNLYRAVGATASCADALAAGPLVVGLTDTRWIDRDTVAGESHVYVVEAEDSLAVACDTVGPSLGGAATRLCLPPLVDLAVGPLPDGVGAVLRGVHEGQEVTMSWAAARALGVDELFLLTKSLDEPDGAFDPIAEGPDALRAHVETDERSRLQFFDLRVVDRCGNLSADEFP